MSAEHIMDNEHRVLSNDIIEQRIMDFNAGEQMYFDLSNLNLNRIPVEELSGLNEEKVYTLDLSNNSFTILTQNMFRIFPNVKQIHLDHNQITNIDNGAFAGLSKLEIINFSYNQLTKIEPYYFTGLLKLYNLDLSHNKIEVIEDNSFHNDEFRLRELQSLNLGNNRIKRIKLSDFDGLSGLKHLTLAHNPITEIITNNSTDRLRYIQVLDISNVDYDIVLQIKRAIHPNKNPRIRYTNKQRDNETKHKNDIPDESARILHPVHEMVINESVKKEFDSETCPICDENIISENKDIVMTGCTHLFHKNCLDMWFRNREANGQPRTCPLCREVLDNHYNSVRDSKKRNAIIYVTGSASRGGRKRKSARKRVNKRKSVKRSKRHNSLTSKNKHISTSH